MDTKVAALRALNWRKGAFRIWAVLSLVWMFCLLAFVAWIAIYETPDWRDVLLVMVFLLCLPLAVLVVVALVASGVHWAFRWVSAGFRE